MRKPLQQAVAGALLAGAAAIALAQQQPAPTIPNTLAPTSRTAPQASSEVQPAYIGEPVATVAAGIPAERARAVTSMVETLNGDASLKGSKLTVVPEEKGILITGVTPSLRQMAQIVNTATQHAGGTRVSHAISTEEVVIDVGASAAGPDARIPPEQIRVDPPRTEDAATAAAPGAPQAAAQGIAQQPAAQAQQAPAR